MPRRATVVVPVDQALAFTADRGWHVLRAPAPWWFEEHEELLARDDPAPRSGLRLA